MNLQFPPQDTHFKSTDWQEYQLPQYRRLVKHAKNRSLVLDVGAHCGIMTRRMARDFYHVVAFEPVHYNLLKNNTEDLPNIEIHPVAATDRNTGAVPIMLNLENSGDCKIGVAEDAIRITVDQRTIDSFNIRGVGAIKMDIQGAELSALQGARKTIARDKPTLMLEIELEDPNRTEIEQFLLDLNYRQIYRRSADTIWIG